MGGDAVGGGEGEEVGVVQIDVAVAGVVGLGLEVLDGAVGGVVVHEGDDTETVTYGGGQLLGGHEEAAVAADRNDRPVAEGDGGAQGGGKAPSERDVVRGVKETPGAVGGPVGV